eukprot:3573359-Amphidinium_carterae.1
MDRRVSSNGSVPMKTKGAFKTYHYYANLKQLTQRAMDFWALVTFCGVFSSRTQCLPLNEFTDSVSCVVKTPYESYPIMLSGTGKARRN